MAGREVEIYKPSEISQLLNAAEQDFLPYIALIAFGGVPREELHNGLTWESINFERGHIIVPAAIAKTGRKRKIVMSENLIAWLAPYRVKSGPIFNKEKELLKFQPFAPKTYVAKTEIYMGCIH